MARLSKAGGEEEADGEEEGVKRVMSLDKLRGLRRLVV